MSVEQLVTEALMEKQAVGKVRAAWRAGRGAVQSKAINLEQLLALMKGSGKVERAAARAGHATQKGVEFVGKHKKPIIIGTGLAGIGAGNVALAKMWQDGRKASTGKNMKKAASEATKVGGSLAKKILKGTAVAGAAAGTGVAGHELGKRRYYVFQDAEGDPMSNREVAEYFMGKAASAESFDDYCAAITMAAFEKCASEGELTKEAKGEILKTLGEYGSKAWNAVKGSASKVRQGAREAKDAAMVGFKEGKLPGATEGGRIQRAANAAAGRGGQGAKWVKDNPGRAAIYGASGAAVGAGGYMLGKKQASVENYIRGHFERELLKEAGKVRDAWEATKRGGKWLAEKTKADKAAKWTGEKMKAGKEYTKEWAAKHPKTVSGLKHSGAGVAIAGGGYAAGRSRKGK